MHAHDARRYARAHLALRAILGSYLGCEPAALRFGAHPQGKPCLVYPHTALRFNLSHSKDRALLAVGVADEIGVDLEAVRDDLPGAELAAAVLCAEELAELAQFAPAAQALPFVACWARKEACLKALGLGLHLDPRGLHVGLQAHRMDVRIDGRDLELVSLPTAPGHCAAVASLGGLGRIEAFEFESPVAPDGTSRD